MNATYTNLGNERNVYARDIKAGQFVFLFGQFREVRSVVRPDLRRRWNYLVTDCAGAEWPLESEKVVTVRDF